MSASFRKLVRNDDEHEQVRSVIRKLSPKVHRLIDERIALKGQIAVLEHAIAKLDDQLKPIITDEYNGKVVTPDFTASMVTANSSHISKEKLLSLGVKPTIIAKATSSKEYTFLKVTLRSNGKSSDSDEKRDE